MSARPALLVTSILVHLAAAAPAQEVSPPPSAPAANPAKTGKERLTDKASDEQRVDNCGVPPEKRGTKPRPDSCDHGAAPTN